MIGTPSMRIRLMDNRGIGVKGNRSRACDYSTPMNMAVNYLDRKCSCGHLYGDHLSPHPSCEKCHCPQWRYSETLDVGYESLEGDLLAALRRAHGGDMCRACKRTFSLSDFSHDKIDRRSRYRVTCQNCGEVFVEINGFFYMPYDNGDVRGFIEVLEKYAKE